MAKDVSGQFFMTGLEVIFSFSKSVCVWGGGGGMILVPVRPFELP